MPRCCCGLAEARPPDAPLLLRVGEAARLLGVSRSKMDELVAAGQVPVVRMGLPLVDSPVSRSSLPRSPWREHPLPVTSNGRDLEGRTVGGERQVSLAGLHGRDCRATLALENGALGRT